MQKEAAVNRARKDADAHKSAAEKEVLHTAMQ